MKNAKKVIRILSWCIFVVYLVALVYFLFFSIVPVLERPLLYASYVTVF